ncbi:rho family-interacting cell polarization regulator 1-like [Kryptolebias marmoratus]|uniref:rho family-interacting cell polarization regulator 1-like n=1 Tax=Kryptolebias marmoratus TaxID=37003 RepID=UPI0007F9283B|nr:rho family-interacting cell polarization regulator 1-like [Kryptolebias marmoratus]
MFTGSTKLPPTKTPQPERLDEVYAALRRGLQSYLQVHQLELDSLGQQIRENKKNSRLGSLYELDKQVKAIERFMRRLEFHLSKVEELYDAYCIQRRLRDGASKMVAAFNSATGSREARESLSEANKGYREYTEHMCSLESELESQMGEFHVKMKGLAGFARLCAGDQYEVLMRYGRQRWRLRGRVEVSNKQMWDGEEFTFLPLITELLSIKVTELKSLANHVVVGSVSCEMLDLFCPLPQTLAVDINDLGTVKLNLEVTWSPFDKDDQTTSCSTVSKRLLSNQSPPDTPSMREQVFYSLLKRQGEMENGTVWSNSSESSDDSSSPALAHQRLTASNALQTAPTAQLSLAPHKSSVSTPSLSSNQEEDETEGGDVFTQAEAVPNGHLQTSCSRSLGAEESSSDCAAAYGTSVQSEDISETSCPDRTSVVAAAADTQDELREESPADDQQTEAETDDISADTEGHQEDQNKPYQSVQELKQPEEAPTVPFPTSASFNQEVETALESFDFLNSSDLDEGDEEEGGQQQEDEVEEEGEEQGGTQEEDQNEAREEKIEELKVETLYSEGSDEEEANSLEFLMEAPEGFRNSDEDCFSESQESSADDVQDLGQVEIPEDKDGRREEKGDEGGEETSADLQEPPSTPS